MKLGVLLFEEFELLDVFGPLEMLGQVDNLSIELISKNAGPVYSAQGPATITQKDFRDSTEYQIILIPGGIGTRKEVHNFIMIDWIARKAKSANYITSVCTGSALLAKAGILNGKKATTNKLAFSWACSQSEQTDWVAKARWVQDANIFTSSGVSAGIDMALALIKEIWGEMKANEIADRAEYKWNQNPDIDPFAIKYGLT
ncbi:DJ-1/PfpI family protein [Microbulbifer sp. THAF38]|uniref:DJ-1/PfpI family protein n=1 Tax=Microbulbifer sp. THAF38 TaxID=2587856 RepID=UPI0012695502|nr:DJ-1/PfpI family protein [Microbulbifer sp. THAF38]QFT55424.1 Isonitrile hydratase [Microbulbifer sp. THAF38]